MELPWQIQAQNMGLGKTCSAHVLLLFCACSFHGNSMNNLLSYCGLVDARISASEKDLPVTKVSTETNNMAYESSNTWTEPSMFSFIELLFLWILATLATFPGHNFNLINLNRVSNFSWRCQLSYEILFVALEWHWEGLDYISKNGWIPPYPPPRYLTDQKSRVF